MLFTESKHRFFERLMQEKPNFDHPVKTMKERDCKHCLYYDERHHRCGMKKCVIFDD